MVSLNTNSRMAVIAPKPLSSKNRRALENNGDDQDAAENPDRYLYKLQETLDRTVFRDRRGLVDCVGGAEHRRRREREHQNDIAHCNVADNPDQILVQIREKLESGIHNEGGNDLHQPADNVVIDECIVPRDFRADGDCAHDTYEHTLHDEIDDDCDDQECRDTAQRGQ